MFFFFFLHIWQGVNGRNLWEQAWVFGWYWWWRVWKILMNCVTQMDIDELSNEMKSLGCWWWRIYDIVGKQMGLWLLILNWTTTYSYNSSLTSKERRLHQYLQTSSMHYKWATNYIILFKKLFCNNSSILSNKLSMRFKCSQINELYNSINIEYEKR